MVKLSPSLKYFERSLSQVLNELTDNKELKAILAYSYGDYGKAFIKLLWVCPIFLYVDILSGSTGVSIILATLTRPS